jgi:hypothetical protein
MLPQGDSTSASSLECTAAGRPIFMDGTYGSLWGTTGTSQS